MTTGEDEGRQDGSPLAICRKGIKEGTPPLFGARKKCLAPTIFRTKNTEKSHLGLIGKNFGKNLRENVSGGRESPQSCGKGARGVLKYERLGAKIVGLFVIAR